MNKTDLQNQCHIIAEVTGSNPVSPTIASVLSEELSLRVLLETWSGSEGKMRLRHMAKKELFKLTITIW